MVTPLFGQFRLLDDDFVANLTTIWPLESINVQLFYGLEYTKNP